MKRSLLALVIILSLFLQVMAQETRPAPVESQQQQAQSDDDVVRITTNLVQVDAVVTDKDGNQVTDLKAEDFEILEDNRPQAISNFSYISAEGGEASVARRATQGVPTMPNAPLRPEQVHRTIAMVADDLGLSASSITFLRRALNNAVTEQIQPNDLVAVLRTAGGIGVLQQFTSDKRLLHAAIERVRWNGTMNRIDSFEAVQSAPVNKFGQGAATAGGGTRSSLMGEDKEDAMRRQNLLLREEIYTYGTINALTYIINGLKNLPGRKSILLFSDSFRYMEGNKDELQRLADHANRASVVIYTMNTRGLQTTGLMAADATSGNTGAELDAKLAARSSAISAGQSALTFLSTQTGGLDIHNINNLGVGLKRILDDQKGYYLIGYRPEKSTFKDGSRFHNIRIKVKRPGLTVRSRRGFFGEEDKNPGVPRTRSEELLAAMTSAFQASGIDLHLTTLFGNDPNAGSFMRSLLHIDARALKFEMSKDGWQTAKIEVAAMTFNDAGKIVDQVTRDETIQVRGGSYQRLLRNGLVYSFDVPVKKAGNYQLRIAVRDPVTKLLGAANQFIEVPDLKKNRLTLSGIYARGVAPAAKMAAAAAGASNASTSSPANTSGLLSKPPEIDEASGAGVVPDAQPGAAMRRLSRGMALDYSFTVFNASVDQSTHRPLLQTELIIYRDGEKVMTKSVKPFAATGEMNTKQLAASGTLELGADLAPGEYILQVIVTDPLAPEKPRTATEWIDFEIVK